MHRIFCHCLAAVLSVSSCHAFCQPVALTGRSERVGQQGQTNGAVVEGFRLRADFAKAQVEQFQPVSLIARLQNTTSDELGFGQSVVPEHDFMFKLTDSAGKPVPLTRFGEKVHTLFSGAFYSYPGGLLKGHQEEVCAFNLAALYDMTVADTYSLTVEHEVPTRDHKSVRTVTSESVTVTITHIVPEYTQPTYNPDLESAQKAATPQALTPADRYVISTGPGPKVIVDVPASDGFEIAVLPPTANFTAGYPVVVTIVLKNTLNTAHTYFAEDPETACDFDVTDLSGKPLPLTAYGHNLARISNIRRYSGPSSVQVTLAPHETKSFQISVSRRYDMTQAGTYLISAKYKIQPFMELVSIPIPMQVQ